MSITVSWYKDSRSVVFFDVSEDFTWSEFHSAKAQSDALMDEVTHNCAILLIGPPNVKVPANALSQGRSMLNQRHPRATLFIITTPNTFVRSLVGILAQVMGKRGLIRAANHLEEAESILRDAGFTDFEREQKSAATPDSVS
jgi:hypothetical protein